ncbi:hypothetical protein ACE6H2_020409 [Prunus campanulata]
MKLDISSSNLESLGLVGWIHRLSRPAMASTNPSSIISDHLYSLDDKLERGRPPPLLKNACEDVAVGEEPVPETASVIDPASISSAASYSSSSWNIRHSCRHALHLPAVLPPTPLLLGTFDIAAGTALHLPAVLPPTPLLLGTSDIAAGTALHLPAVLPPFISQVVFFGLGSVGSVHSLHLS